MVKVIEADELRLYSDGEDITSMFAVHREGCWFMLTGPFAMLDHFGYEDGARHLISRHDRRRLTEAVDRGDTVTFKLPTRWVLATNQDDPAESAAALAAIRAGEPWPETLRWFERL